MAQTLRHLQQQLLSDIQNQQCQKNIYQNEIFPPERLVQIYQNDYITTLTDALKASYSTVCRLVGVEFFNYLAKSYIDQYAPTSGNIQDYGQRFSQFIKEAPRCQSLPYLSDIALLEYYYEQCYYHQNSDYDFAKNYPNFAQNIPQNALKYSYLLQSDYPIIAIWQLDENSQPLDLSRGGDNVVLYKWQNVVKILRIEPRVLNFLMKRGQKK